MLKKCVFVGYSRTQKGYKCYNPTSRHVIVSVDVTFFKDQPYFTTQTIPTVPPDDIECVLPTLPPISLPQASSTGFQFADRTYHRRGTAPATVVQPSLDSSVPSSVDVPSSDPNPDPDPPIATRKGTRSCVGRPVDRYTLYSGLSDCLCTRAWFGKFSDAVIKFGLKRCQVDHSVFSSVSSAGCILLVVYVDDIIITDSN